MTFAQARNAIVSGLEEHIGCPVLLSEQIPEIPDFPYCYYSVLTPRATEHFFGLLETQSVPGGYVQSRSEPVSATMSFTFCSMSRVTGDGGYIFGEDEALDLSEKANCFFLLKAHNIVTEYGDIVISNVGSPTNRTSFQVEESIRRYGFDIRFSYIRTDEIETEIVSNPGYPKGKLQP